MIKIERSKTERSKPARTETKAMKRGQRQSDETAALLCSATENSYAH
jgi:hypothetical protein